MLSILIADDQADVLMGHHSFRDSLERAFGEFGVPRDQLEVFVESGRKAALQRIEDTGQKLDVVFIDIMWPAMDLGTQDGAKDLLIAAVSREDCVVITLSNDGPALLNYLFNKSKSRFRPHAALFKPESDYSDVFAGTLAAAFSNARLPLRSLRGEFIFDYADEMSSKVILAIGEVVIRELVGMVLPGIISAKIQVLAGGLSGAAVVHVNADRNEGGRRVKQSAILKLAQDKKNLAGEFEAHKSMVPLFPTNQFAGLLKEDIVDFGGWSALAFRAAPGRTAASSGQGIVAKRRWNQIFTGELMSSYVENAEVASIRFADWAVSEEGLLAGNRWERLCKSAETIGASRGYRGRLNRGSTAMFSDTSHQTALSVVHGDFHTRNVLVADDDRVFWIDAASIRKLGIWCEDIGRFAVWTACGLLDPLEAVDANAKLLRSALVGEPQPTEKSWQDSLRKQVQNTLAVAMTAWARKGVEIDANVDWRFVVACELLRASYSFEMFDLQVRLAALEAAMSV
jgi:hypothetical protein